MMNLFCILTLLVAFQTSRVIGEVNVCTSDDTECSCTVKSGNGFGKGYQLTCDRLRNPPAHVPVLKEVVTELDMFRTSPNQSHISTASFRSATNLQVLRIESCSIREIEVEAFQGLYAVQTLNLANNELKSLPEKVFADLTQLHTLDISYNSLEVLTLDVFQGLINLKYLDLSFNSLQSAHENLFKPLQSLKTLRLKNTLLGITVLPDGLLSSIPDLNALNLDDNKLTQLQPQLIRNNKMLKELRIRKNNLQTVNGEIFQHLGLLSTFDIGENPFDCDCHLLGYKLWLDSSNRWDKEQTGYCNSPPEIYGQPIANLPEYKFICLTTTSPLMTAPTTLLNTKNEAFPMTQPGTNSSSNNTGSLDSDKHPAITEADDNKSKVTESSIIIGCSVGAALLLILINVLILCGVKRARRHTGTLKTKYIIRPDIADEEKRQADGYMAAHKEPRVDGTPNGYIISNGISGFYHTGSRGQLLTDGKDGSLYDPHSDSPLKLHNRLKKEITSNTRNDSIFSIPLRGDEKHGEHAMVSSENYSPNMNCTHNWQTPTSIGTWPTRHRVRFKSTNQLYDKNFSSLCAPSNNIENRSLTTELANNIGEAYYKLSYMNKECLFETQSQDGRRVKYSSGSGDSGLHSNFSYSGLEDNVSPSLSYRQMASHHELNQSHISIGAKKIRNETYV